MFEERPYQIAAENSVLTEYDKGVRKMLLSLATGTGKTIVMSRLYKRLKSRLPGQLIVLAHREELIDQNRAKMQAVNPGLKVDKEMASHHADPATADVIMASVATLGRKGTKRVEIYNWSQVDKIFVDEAHHSTADSYGNIFTLAGSFDQPTHKLLLGVTATPSRGDGTALAKVYDKIAYVYSIRQAIEDGWLVDVRGYRVRTDTDISQVKTSAGDFAQEALEDAVNTPKRNHRVVLAWKELAFGRQTIAFCVGIQHAKDLADRFEAEGVVAAAVWGDDPERAEKLRLHREGKITVLCNCGVLTEGYDDWRVSCVLLARPTKSPVLFTQMVGRGTRLQEGLGNLKELLLTPKAKTLFVTDGFKKDCIVIDVVDNAGKNSLVTLPTLMGLGCSFDLRGQSMVGAVRQIEEMQDKHPSIDFTTLDDIDKMQSFIESVNMFDVRFPEEVEQNSELTWFRSAEGGYRMSIPAQEKGTKSSSVHIFQNLLNKWEIVGSIGQAQFHGVRNSIEEAFKVADEQIRQRAPWAMKVLAREATWHDKQASPQQMALLKKLMPWKTFPANLGRGQASRLIGERLAGKAKK